MAPSSDFAELVRRTRESKGYSQAVVTERLAAFYGDQRAYRRIELAERRPSRDAAIAILRRGLQVESVEEVNSGLALLGYAPLRREELPALELVPPPESATLQNAGSAPSKLLSVELVDVRTKVFTALLGAIAIVVVVVSTWWTPSVAVATTCAIIYGSLFAISVLLETHYQQQRRGVWAGCILALSIMLVSSCVGLGLDAWFVQKGSGMGLAIMFAVSWLAAAGQWLLVRSVLADKAVVPLRFQPHTAQIAHLKNTFYFLLIAWLFWLSPMHAIAVLRREFASGNVEFVRRTASQYVMVTGDVVAFGPVALAFILLALAVVSVTMGSRLLDNLKPDHRLNGFSLLLYTRAAACFGLAILSFGWYAVAIGSLLH